MAKTRLGRPRGESKENAARRRKQLIKAAVDSITQYGLSATTLATVATSAGLSQGVAVFYFKTKESLLAETLRRQYETYTATWRAALENAGSNPLERLMALVFADLDPSICNPKELALWNSFWGEVQVRPRFAEICDTYDQERTDQLMALCEATKGLIAEDLWTPESVADALDLMADGIWIRMHISPNYMTNADGRETLARLMASIFQNRADQVWRRVRQLNSEST